MIYENNSSVAELSIFGIVYRLKSLLHCTISELTEKQIG